MQQEAKQEMKDFLSAVGGFPLLEGESWNGSNFNKSKVFEKFPLLLFAFFIMGFKIEKDMENPKFNNVLVK